MGKVKKRKEMAGYSEDLRVKVVEFLKKGHTIKETAETFGISMKSVSIWKKMDKEGKRLVFEFVPRSPHRINHEKLLTYVKEHRDAYLREIAAHFSVGLTTIWNALHRLGVKYKKTKNLQRSGSRKAEKIYRIRKKTG
jgi:transposase